MLSSARVRFPICSSLFFFLILWEGVLGFWGWGVVEDGLVGLLRGGSGIAHYGLGLLNLELRLDQLVGEMSLDCGEGPLKESAAKLVVH